MGYNDLETKWEGVGKMEFIPDQSEHKAQQVPFFDDVTSEQGWRGHTTGKSIEKLKLEIIASISRLGGQVQTFQRGIFQVGDQKRDGFRIHYIEDQGGKLLYGRLDVAALPVKTDYRLRQSYEKRREGSLKMALFMMREALDGTWFLQQLSPGYSPLMPWMLEESTGKTLTQLWTERTLASRLLAPPGGASDVVDAEFTEG